MGLLLSVCGGDFAGRGLDVDGFVAAFERVHGDGGCPEAEELFADEVCLPLEDWPDLEEGL